ncbi:MAG TPA: DUF4434 domain-containing protein [Parapedobacter sp.]|uniref:DUF4434 domain-containing protein n=1 Tax=Parapedobacter sp. TaxID=1958893 RepID=UPI002BCB810B|nr:DUF4434 domain-containing protein [Parapedobacter sp.]HWK57284.1 DUF4434 domain-containing protein [Parapedobacter sp.]
MKNGLSLFTSIGLVAMIGMVICCSNNVVPPNTVDKKDGDKERSIDVLRMIYAIAEEEEMKVMADLNMGGGMLYKKHTVDDVTAQYATYIPKFHKRYGEYASFWGWYINNELTLQPPLETEISGFWRAIWKSAVDECKKVAPESVVTISPFYIMDRDKHRGFDFLEPIEYEQWWAKTLSHTGIDILMLQDSGAEHLSFFSLEDRRPFFQAFKNACDQAGSELWLNVESGEIDADSWDEAVTMEQSKTQEWVYTPTEWLAQKLELAAEYGERIINWGYYPFMTPTASAGPFLFSVDGIEIPTNLRAESYSSYRQYYEGIKDRGIQPGSLTKPLMRGTLWWLPVMYEGWSEEAIEKTIREQIADQKALGFDMLWIVNAPANMEWAIGKEK